MSYFPAYTRTTVKLTGVTVRQEARFDPRSQTALLWAQQALTEAGGTQPTLSAVLRRAIQLYAAHLETLEGQFRLRSEFNDVKRISTVAPMPKPLWEAMQAKLQQPVQLIDQDDRLLAFEAFFNSVKA